MKSFARCDKYVPLVLLILTCFSSCGYGGGFNMENYKKAVKSGFVLIPESLQIEKLFGDSDHFISYSGPNVGQDWNTEVFFGGRYTLTMQVDVKTDSSGPGFSKITSVVGKPTFYLNELRSIDISPDGSASGAESANGWQFDADKWAKVVEAKGDFSVIDITLKKDAPLKGFKEYVKAVRAPRIQVHPD